MITLESSLLANLEVFVTFARNRLGEPHMAEDVVQESLVKALTAERRPKHEEAVQDGESCAIGLPRTRECIGRNEPNFVATLSPNLWPCHSL